MSNIFISGIAGFLGSHLAEALHSRGHSVYGCDSFIGGDVSNIPPGAVFHDANCLDLDRMTELLRIHNIDVLYHCAATAHEGFSVFSPLTITRNVYEASVSMFVAAARTGVKRVIQLSSMARYGKQDVPFTELMLPRPQDPYGIAKVAAEETLKVLSAVHGFDYVIAVPHNIYGIRQRYTDPFRNVIGIFINRILQEKPLIIYGNGSQMRCFSHISDCITPLVDMATHRGAVGQVINIGPDSGTVSIKSLAEIICFKMGVPFAPLYLPDRPQEVKLAMCSADRARLLLGYEATTSLSDGLDEMISWMREQGPKPFSYHLPLEIVNDKTPKTWSEEMM